MSGLAMVGCAGSAIDCRPIYSCRPHGASSSSPRVADALTARTAACITGAPSHRGGTMPVATVRGAAIHYQIVGEKGPWVSLSPGGRRAIEGVRSLGQRIAQAGYRVLLH